MIEAKTTRELAGFDLRDLPDEFYENPFSYYHGLREQTPVRLMPDGSILLTRHRDLGRVYRDTAIFSSDKKKAFKPAFGDSLLFEHHTSSLVFNDPPLHTRVRKAIVGALAPRALQPLEQQVRELVDQLLADIEQGSIFDAVADFSSLIPIRIIGDLLMIPQDRREPLRDWSLAILGALEPAISKVQFDLGCRSVEEFLEYLEELVERRKAEMTDSDDDILSRLIREVPDGILHRELLQNCIFLLNAGHETTTNVIASGILLLSKKPPILQQLKENPSLWPKAVEEILRMESPNQLGNRQATTDFEIDGVTYGQGTQITLSIGAANRDPTVFDNPDEFQLDRGKNPHFAFAQGPHLCAGLTVARIEARIALAAIFARYPRLHVDGTIIRARRARFRGFDYLPIRAAQ